MSPNHRRATEADGVRLTVLLNRMQIGDPEAGNQAIGIVYSELHRIASHHMHHERQGHTLQTTAVINEAYLRLVAGEPIEFRNRQHFLVLASQQMRRILIEHARARQRSKRGGDPFQMDLDQACLLALKDNADLLCVHEALEDLERLDQRAARIVELKYFGGCTDEEIAEALEVAVPTVRRDWRFARDWLYDQLRPSGPRAT